MVGEAAPTAPAAMPAAVVVADVPEGDVAGGAPARRRIGIGRGLAIAWLVLVTLLVVGADLLPLQDPGEVNIQAAKEGPGTPGHVLGGDALGRDMVARLVFGARTSLLIAIGAIGAGLVVGGTMGIIAGYFRGPVGTVISGVFDILLAVPPLVLSLALVAFLRGTPESGGGLPTEAVLVIALGIVSTPVLGRVSRASALAWSQREFVMAARAMGSPNRRVIWREVLPNVLPALSSIALLGVAVVIVAEGSLSILGVGVDPSVRPSWGNMIAFGRESLRDAAYTVFLPAAAIFLTVLSLNTVGDLLRARADVGESSL